jgi:hypothetical protein
VLNEDFDLSKVQGKHVLVVSAQWPQRLAELHALPACPPAHSACLPAAPLPALPARPPSSSATAEQMAARLSLILFREHSGIKHAAIQVSGMRKPIPNITQPTVHSHPCSGCSVL